MEIGPSAMVGLSLIHIFQMNGDDIRPALGEIGHIPDRLFHHQMNVKRDIRNLPERGDNAHPERDGWYKHAVHDINVQKMCIRDRF